MTHEKPVPVTFKMSAGGQAIFDLLGDFSPFDEDINQKAFAAEFRQVKPGTPIHINLNSPGGYVDEAMGIAGLLKQHTAPISITVTGYAMSAATLITSIPRAKVTMQRGTIFMIHNPARMAYGDQHDLDHAAKTTEVQAQAIAEIYADRTGLSIEKLRAMMDAETWLTAAEARDLGFVDAVDDQILVVPERTGDTVMLGGVSFSGHIPPRFLNIVESNMTENTKAATEKAAFFASVEDLRAAQPALVSQIEEKAKAEAAAATAAALAAERERIRDLDAIRNAANAELVDRAKFETFEDAASVALSFLKAQNAATTKAAADIKADAAEVADHVAQLDTKTADPVAKEAAGFSAAEANRWIELAKMNHEAGRA